MIQSKRGVTGANCTDYYARREDMRERDGEKRRAATGIPQVYTSNSVKGEIHPKKENIRSC